jgi:hypothetical protein
MITAIDFGTSEIRTACFEPQQPGRLKLRAERSAYTMIPDCKEYRAVLDHFGYSYAVCDGSLVIVGNQALKAKWLSRVPMAPLLEDPSSEFADPTARQLLNVLVEAMLPACTTTGGTCAVVLPGHESETGIMLRQREYLCRLVRMRGYRVLPVRPAEAALLSTSSASVYSGCTVVVGSEFTEVCVARNGVPLSFRFAAIGRNMIDRELSRKFRIYVFDSDGTCYLNTDTVCEKIQNIPSESADLSGNFEQALLSSCQSLADQILTMALEAIEESALLRRSNDRSLPIPVTLTGGGAETAGLKYALEQKIALAGVQDRITLLNVAPDAGTSVIRGAIISAGLAEGLTAEIAA